MKMPQENKSAKSSIRSICLLTLTLWMSVEAYASNEPFTGRIRETLHTLKSSTMSRATHVFHTMIGSFRYMYRRPGRYQEGMLVNFNQHIMSYIISNKNSKPNFVAFLKSIQQGKRKNEKKLLNRLLEEMIDTSVDIINACHEYYCVEEASGKDTVRIYHLASDKLKRDWLFARLSSYRGKLLNRSELEASYQEAEHKHKSGPINPQQAVYNIITSLIGAPQIYGNAGSVEQYIECLLPAVFYSVYCANHILSHWNEQDIAKIKKVIKESAEHKKLIKIMNYEPKNTTDNNIGRR